MLSSNLLDGRGRGAPKRWAHNSNAFIRHDIVFSHVFLRDREGGGHGEHIRNAVMGRSHYHRRFLAMAL